MGIRFGFVGTFPPTHCGIATFSRSLMNAIEKLDSHQTSVVRLVDTHDDSTPIENNPKIVSTLTAGDPESITRSIEAINSMDVAVIQHEFGIYGGPDGNEILTLLRHIKVPTIVVLHTVPAGPTWHQSVVLTEVCSRASAVVTMTTVARDRVISKYSGDANKVFIIPHGASSSLKIRPRKLSGLPLILTWGLIGPGKGIEWAIEAMDQLRDMNPSPHYVVAGRTHPKVLMREGESYREKLQKRIDELGLVDAIDLRAEYLSDTDLAGLLSATSIVLLPYDSIEQVTSGVLIEAVTAQRPVVATRFPHAEELLAQGVGILVPQADPDALAQAIRRILENPELALEMSRKANIIASKLLWSSVATGYVRLAKTLMRAQAVA